MLIAHRIRLNPNNAQRDYLTRAAGTARFAYNWALDEWKRQYVAHKFNPELKQPNEAALRRQLNQIKRDHYPWMLEVTKCAPQMAIVQLGQAFDNFFSGRAHYPRYRRKGRDDRFTISCDQFHIENKRIHIPKLGWVRMLEALRFIGRIVTASVSQTAGHWYASITVDCPAPSLPSAENQGSVGVDLGISALATLSTGEKVGSPKALRCLLSSVRRLSRACSRKKKGSRNLGKARLRLAKLHERIAHIRCNHLHQFTTGLTRRFHTIAIEDLRVKNMMKNRRLAQAISDMGWSELRRQLKYKAALRGGRVIVADKWYLSTKTCSNCGRIIERLALAQRSWTCSFCGFLHDRDVNAAINLRNMAVSSTVSACGGGGSGSVRKHSAKPAPTKQESKCES